jgi:prenyltransferase beta subunit
VESIAELLIRTAACARRFLENDSRDEIARFILSRQNSDGGFRGKGAESDLYYTVFAAAGLKALGRPVPVFRLWNYVRRFGTGDELDLVHLVCLIQLRSAFPMFGRTRRHFFQSLETRRAESAYDLFLKQLAGDRLGVARLPAAPRPISLTDPTPVLAAALIVSRAPDQAAVNTLLNRVCRSGGFAATDQLNSADLLSTATALFALRTCRADLDPVRPCLEFVESLWRDSGGFVGHAADEIEDVEYTFYALLSIGCLTAKQGGVFASE